MIPTKWIVTKLSVVFVDSRREKNIKRRQRNLIIRNMKYHMLDRVIFRLLLLIVIFFNPSQLSYVRHCQSMVMSTAISIETMSQLKSSLGIDTKKLQRQIASGRVYQQQHFLSSQEIQVLINQMDRMRTNNVMKPSGLSNKSKGNVQNFHVKNDRTTAPAPWWDESLQGVNVSCDGESKNKACRDLNSVSTKIQTLRMVLARLLNRPTMHDPTLAHECYYSRSCSGSSLKRHMDEKHEEMKGPRGWTLPSRRSLSWLVYLSDSEWDVNLNGGALRIFSQQNIEKFVKPGVMETGCHDGNLQVGWLRTTGHEGSSSTPLPVYLDSWYKDTRDKIGELEPKCILYYLDDGKIRHITQAFSHDSIQMPLSDFLSNQSRGNGSISPDKNEICAEPELSSFFVQSNYAKSFYPIEDRVSWDNGYDPFQSFVEDISPERGSLVIFDSVSVPHEVMEVKEGVRGALAGWFHEETQSFPESFYL